MTPRILLVEDDETVSSVVAAYLERAGLGVLVCADGADAARTWREDPPALVVLDVMLPGRGGLEVLAERRAAGDRTPVLVLSARGDEEDRIVGLESGADDYVAKPFSPRELVLRVNALLGREQRRRGAGVLQERRVRAGALVVDLAARTVLREGRPVDLTVREFDLLAFLVVHPGEAFTKRQLLQRVWGWDFGDTSTVAVHVRRLRRKVEADPAEPDLVRTVRGIGYRLDAVAAAEEDA